MRSLQTFALNSELWELLCTGAVSDGHPEGVCVYLYPKPFLAEQRAGDEEISGKGGEEEEQGTCLWPFFPLLKPKAALSLMTSVLAGGQENVSAGSNSAKITLKGDFLPLKLLTEVWAVCYSRRAGPLLSLQCREHGKSPRIPQTRR